MTEPGPSSPNAFEQDKPGTAARDRAEGRIEGVRDLGGVFVEAVRATRLPMVLTDPTLPGDPIVFANQAFVALSGYAMDEVLGQSPHFMNGPDTDPEDAARFVQILANDADGAVETIQYAKDGRRFVATVLLSAFKDDAGQTCHHFLTWADVTRRVDAEDDNAALRTTHAALRESEAKYRVLFGTIDSGYALTDIVRDEDGRIVDLFGVDFNRSYTQHSGLPPFAGRRASEVIAVQPEWLRQFEDVARTGVPVRYENYIAERDRWVSTHYSLVGDPGSDRVAVVFDDITERKRAETALRESEERQAFLLKLSDALRAEPNADAIALFVLDALTERLKLDRCYIAEYRLDQDRGDLLHQVGNDRAPPLPDSVRLSDFPEAFEIALGRTLIIDDVGKADFLSDADKRNMQGMGMGALVTSAARKGENVPLFAIVAVSADPREWTSAEVALIEEVNERTWAAVERARAEASLRESEERFRGFAENSADVLWIVNATSMKLEYLSPAFERVWGESREAVMQDIGRWAELVHPDDRAQAAQGMPRLLAGESYTGTYRIVRPDGAVRWIRDTGFPIHEDGVTRVGGIAQDITDLLMAEAAVSGSEQRLRLVVDNARDYAIFTTDTTGAITGWWGGAERVFGWTADEAVGQAMAITYTQEDRKQQVPEGEMRTAREEGRAPNVRWHVRKDGSRAFIDGIMTPLRDPDGALTGFLKIGQDVTERHASEQRQKLLLAELQHRVRNTLAVLRSIARRTAANSDDVEEMAAHLDGRVSAFARVQSAITRNPDGLVDLTALIEDELLAYATHESDAVRLDGPNVGLPAKAAETVSLAVHELATNAVKHGALSEPNGRLRVSWRVEERDKERRLEFEWEESSIKLASEASGHQGFGTELLTQMIPYERRAETSLELRPNGARFTMSMPLEAPAEA